MNADRWRQMTRVYMAVRTKLPAARAAALLTEFVEGVASVDEGEQVSVSGALPGVTAFRESGDSREHFLVQYAHVAPRFLVTLPDFLPDDSQFLPKFTTYSREFLAYFFANSRELLADFIADSRKFVADFLTELGHVLPEFTTDGRKFIAHLVTESQNLRSDGVDARRQLFQIAHFFLENLDPSAQRWFVHPCASRKWTANAVPDRPTTVTSSAETVQASDKIWSLMGFRPAGLRCIGDDKSGR
jgi:hypothetical protein